MKNKKVRARLKAAETVVSCIGFHIGMGWTLRARCVTTGTERNPSASISVSGNTAPYLNHGKSQDRHLVDGHMKIQDVIHLRDYLSDIIELAAENCPICRASSGAECKK